MKTDPRVRKKTRIRKKINGTEICPRVSIYKSLKALYAQVIDDNKGVTLCSAKVDGKNCDSAKELGKLLSEKAKQKNIEQIVFDRNGYAFHGVVKSFADSARECGLKF